MLAKVIAHGPDRDAAIAILCSALRETVVAGVSTNIAWLLDLLDSEAFRRGEMSTQTAAEVRPMPPDHRIAALAAAAHLLDATSDGDSGPWTSLGRWRLLGDAPLTIHGEGWEAQLDVLREGGGWAIRDPDTGTVARWSRDDDGVLVVDISGETIRAAVLPLGTGVEVFAQGGRWAVERGPTPRLAPGQRTAASTGRVVAPMPGSVVGVHVAEGDRVEPGQPLVTLTAMKMEIVLEAPIAGVVEAIACAPGDLVAADHELITLRAHNSE
jgi:acetyl/propionyl-CoA carboxylase alpha subunit